VLAVGFVYARVSFFFETEVDSFFLTYSAAIFFPQGSCFSSFLPVFMADSAATGTQIFLSASVFSHLAFLFSSYYVVFDGLTPYTEEA